VVILMDSSKFFMKLEREIKKRKSVRANKRVQKEWQGHLQGLLTHHAPFRQIVEKHRPRITLDVRKHMSWRESYTVPSEVNRRSGKIVLGMGGSPKDVLKTLGHELAHRMRGDGGVTLQLFGAGVYSKTQSAATRMGNAAVQAYQKGKRGGVYRKTAKGTKVYKKK